MFRKLMRKQKSFGGMRAQAIVEFAIALPVLLLILVGIMEGARMLFMYASVVNSSRDAVRYASAYGYSDNGYLKYKYCDGIRDVAKKSGFLLKLQNSDITISYDRDQSSSDMDGTLLGTCTAIGGEQSITIKSEDRVTVQVRATYSPIMNKLLPFGTRTFTATSSRTILGVIDLDN